jgi:hypothetical protein
MRVLAIGRTITEAIKKAEDFPLPAGLVMPIESPHESFLLEDEYEKVKAYDRK